MRTLIFGLVLGVAQVGQAIACSCVGATIERRVLPDGHDDVPIDAAVRVFVSGGLPYPVRDHLGEEYRLLGPDGPVPLTASTVRTRIDLKPNPPLAADTAYRVEQLFAYDASGRRLDDDERLRFAREGRSASSRRWYEVARFTTGSKRGAAPKPVAVEPSEVTFRFGGGDCGPGTSLSVKYTPTDDPLAVLELAVEGHGVVDTEPMPTGPTRHGPWLSVSDLMCNPDPHSLGKRGPFVSTVTVVGASGLRRSTAPHANGAEPGLIRTRGRGVRLEVPAGLPKDPHWFAAPIEPSPIAPATGPPTCRAGPAEVRSRLVASDGAPIMYDERLALVRVGDAVGAAVTQGPAVVVAGAGDARTLAEAGTSARSVPAGDGTVALVGDHQRGHATLTAIRLDAAGQPLWRQVVAAKDTNWHGRVAACGDRVYAAWSKVVGKDYGGARLHWAVLDLKGGQVLARAGARTALNGEPEGAALGCAGDGSAWLVSRPKGGREPASLALRLAPDGTTRALPVAGPSGNLAIAPSPGGALVASDEAGVGVRLLDARGQAGARVAVADEGAKPAIARHGAHYLVAWEADRGRRLWVTAVDPAGAVAEPRLLGGYRNPSWRVDGDRLWLGVVEAGGARVIELACTSAPPTGPPRQLP